MTSVWRIVLIVAATLSQPASALLAAVKPPAVTVLAASKPLLRAGAAPRAPRPLACAPPELPSKSLLRAIVRCGGRATASDIAAEAGLDIDESQRQLLVLARLVGADLQVSDDGQIVFAFEDEKQLRRSLRSATWRMRGRETWDAVSPALGWTLRASFGLALLSSVTLVFSALMVLSMSKDDRNGSGSGDAMVRLPMQMWGPHPLDFLYYTRPYRYQPPGEMGFLQSCFSLLFGDADPNTADPAASLQQRRSRAIAALVRANGGTVTAEQLAPLLEPPAGFGPDDAAAAHAAWEAGESSTLPREDWVLPALLQFGGEPIVSDEGDLLYTFPQLMVSAAADDGGGSLGLLGGAGGATAGALSPSGAVDDAAALAEVAAALGWAENPPGWRPAKGDAVVVTRLLGAEELLGAMVVGGFGGRQAAQRAAGRRQSLAPLVGRVGRVVDDEGPEGVLPLSVAFDGADAGSGGSGGAGSFAQSFALRELAPSAGIGPGSYPYLVELPRRFSAAPPSQLLAAGALGVANLGGVLYLGTLLPRVRATTAGAASLLATLRGLYPPLLLYAVGFVALPVARAARLRRANAEVEERNERRGAWAATMQGVQGTLRGVRQSRLVRGTVESRPAAFVARKLRAARERRTARRQLREADAAFSSAQLDGGTADELARDAAALDEFDRKLAALEATTSTTTVAAPSPESSEEAEAAAKAAAARLAEPDAPSLGPPAGGGDGESEDQ